MRHIILTTFVVISILMVLSIFMISCSKETPPIPLNQEPEINEEPIIMPPDMNPYLKTAKDIFEKTEPDAKAWSNDAELTSISSSASVVNGKSVQWQVWYYSKEKDKNFVFMMVNNKPIIPPTEQQASKKTPITGTWINSDKLFNNLKEQTKIDENYELNLALEQKSMYATVACEPCWHAWINDQRFYFDASTGNFIKAI